jgi:hypothetical protein
MMKKRVVFAGDFHSGHEYGLTPPAWWSVQNSKDSRVSKAAKFQRQLWNFYNGELEKLKPIYLLSVPGDCIEGKGLKSGSKELLTADRLEQVSMAAEAIRVADAKNVRICYGTKYHTGQDEDFEKVLADKGQGNVVIHGHDFFSVNGVNIDVKHKIGSSSTPNGRTSAIARSRLWNVIWNSEHERQPKADILIRGHVHYYGGSFGSSWIGMTLPALTYNSEFGIRECEGVVDVGFVVFDFDEDGSYSWHPVLAQFDQLKVKADKL